MPTRARKTKPNPAAIEGIIQARKPAGVKRVDPRQVPTAEWVRMKCQYGCGGYGGCLTCPPHSPTPEQTRRLLDGYTVGYLIHWGHSIPRRKVLAAIEREVFLSGFYKAFTLAAGPCDLCRECNLETCLHPEMARPAMEACGIDVYQTARAAGFEIEVIKTPTTPPNYFSLLLVE